MLQDVAAAAAVHGDLIALEHALHRGGIVREVAHRHADLPIAVLPRRRQPPDLGSRIFHLAVKGICFIDMNGQRLPLIRCRRPEAIPLQVAQRRLCLRGGQLLRLEGTSLPRCQLGELIEGPVSGPETLQPAVFLPQERHRDAVGAAQQDADGLQLLGSEVGKAIQIDILPVGVAALRQGVVETVHVVGEVHPVPAEAAQIGGTDEGYIPELVRRVPLHALRPGHQVLRGDTVSLQLLRQVNKAAEEGDLLGGAAVHRQDAGHVLDGPLHHQHLAAVVQGGLPQSAHGLQNPLAQPPEGQHLPKPAGRRAAGAAEIHLRGKGGVVRHQQDLGTQGTVCLDALQHRPGFSRVGSAPQQIEHRSSSSRCLLGLL